MKLRVLIIDDEPLGRERLRRLLASEPEIEIIGECEDGPSAVAMTKALQPDVLFLDIQMPGMDGFEVLRSLGKKLPEVVFVTAYDEHAVRAFQTRALDYLLKPASRPRLRQTLERVREKLAGSIDPKREAAVQEVISRYARRLAVRNGERILYVIIDDIDWVEASGNYVVLHVARENHIIRETIGSLEKALSPGIFLRISRSVIVNLRRVKELQSVSPGEHVAILHDGRRLPITRSLREIEEKLRYA